MSDRTLIDFDAFRAERTRQPLQFKIGGVTYDLPPSIPASVVVEVIAMQRQKGAGADVPMDVIISVGEAIFGETLWKQVIDEHRLTADELPSLITMVITAYSGEVKGKDVQDPQKSQTPRATKAPASRSSKAGRSSKRTS